MCVDQRSIEFRIPGFNIDMIQLLEMEIWNDFWELDFFYISIEWLEIG